MRSGDQAEHKKNILAPPNFFKTEQAILFYAVDMHQVAA